jgi:hypothetical protein
MPTLLIRSGWRREIEATDGAEVADRLVRFRNEPKTLEEPMQAARQTLALCFDACARAIAGAVG